MKPQAKTNRLMGDDPLDGDTILERFYRPQTDEAPLREVSPMSALPVARQSPAKAVKREKEKPTHYKVVCISLYTEDIENLESLVAELKKRGHTKANKSQLIRAALAQVDLGKIPKGF